MRQFPKLRILVCTAFMTLMPTFADSAEELNAEALAAQAKAMTEVLKKVADQQSAQALEKDLSQWRATPLIKPSPEQSEQIQSFLDKDEAFREAFMASAREMQRIEGLGDDVFSAVMMSLTGEKPVNLVAHIEKTTELLRQIKTEEDLLRLGPELNKAWKPFADMMGHDLERAVEFMQNNPALQPALKEQHVEVARINDDLPELAEKVRVAMLGDELAKKMDERLVEATTQRDQLRLKLLIFSLQTAISRFHADTGRMPLSKPNEKADLILNDGKALADVLNAVDKKENPKGLKYLDPSTMVEGAIVDPWGNSLRIVLDASGDGKVSLSDEYGDKLINDTILIDSAGPDGDFATIEDNVVSWELE